MPAAYTGKVDPVTFEVLRHRLWAINDEQGAMAARISGSPAIYEGFDFNIGILTAAGKGVFTGVYIGHHAIPLEMVVAAVRERFAGDIEPGDMFFTNDPWCGAIHANDGVLAAPVFRDGEIVCWTAIVMHDMDVGGPVAGSFVVGAEDAFGEAPLYPPLKLVRGDSLRPDIYAILQRNCRAPEKNYLNMKARISSQLMSRRRINEIIDAYGKQTFTDLLDQIIDYTNFVLKDKLSRIPDGTWWEHGYLDHDGVTDRIYKLVVKLTKRGSRLTFDYTGTDRQAPGSINCTAAGLRGGTLGPLLAMLFYDLPWSTGALEDIVEIIAEEGTLNNAAFPAGCSMASLQASHATQHVASNAIAKMLCCSPDFKEEAQACWQPYLTGIFTSGEDQRGQHFVDGFPDGGAGGGGARTFADGIDAGGPIHSLRAAIPNVEINEYVQPVIELYRRFCADTGGHGRYRGGAGIEFAYTPYGTSRPLTAVTISAGAAVPSGRGIFGGYPSSVNASLVLRGTDILARFGEGQLPTALEQLQTASRELLPAKAVSRLLPGDVHTVIVTGGGGYGDPLQRDPKLVRRDVADGTVSPQAADLVYGVVLEQEPPTTNEARTAERRRQLLAERKTTWNQPAAARQVPQAENPADFTLVGAVADCLELREGKGRRWLFCRTCGARLAPADANLRDYLARSAPHAADFLAAVNTLVPVPAYALVEYGCPSCGTLLSVDVLLHEEASQVRPDFRLDI